LKIDALTPDLADRNPGHITTTSDATAIISQRVKAYIRRRSATYQSIIALYQIKPRAA